MEPIILSLALLSPPFSVVTAGLLRQHWTRRADERAAAVYLDAILREVRSRPATRV